MFQCTRSKVAYFIRWLQNAPKSVQRGPVNTSWKRTQLYSIVTFSMRNAHAKFIKLIKMESVVDFFFHNECSAEFWWKKNYQNVIPVAVLVSTPLLLIVSILTGNRLPVCPTVKLSVLVDERYQCQQFSSWSLKFRFYTDKNSILSGELTFGDNHEWKWCMENEKKWHRVPNKLCIYVINFNNENQNHIGWQDILCSR